MLQAEAVGSQVQIDGSRLTKAERLIAQITKRLDVAERVLESPQVDKAGTAGVVEKDEVVVDPVYPDDIINVPQSFF